MTPTQKLFVSMTVLSSLLSSVAYAEPVAGTSPQNDSGYDAYDLQLQLEPGWGVLKTKLYELKFGAGFGDINGDRGSSFEASATTKVRVIGKSGHSNGDGTRGEYGLYLNPGVKARFDYTGKASDGSPVRKQIELSGLTLFKARGAAGPYVESHDGTLDSIKADGSDASNGKLTYKGNITCLEQMESTNAYYVSELPTLCKEGFSSEYASSLSDPERELLRSRKFASYHYEGAPSATGEVLIGDFTGVYEENENLDVHVKAAKITFIGAGGQFAFAFNSRVQFDLNIMAKLGMLAGRVDLFGRPGTTALNHELTAGGGVSIRNVGPFGNLIRFGYQFNMNEGIGAEKRAGEQDDGSNRYRSDWLHRTTHTLSASDILDTGIVLTYTQETDQVRLSGVPMQKEIKTNLLKAAFTF
jgi:hypothetical protein